MQYLCPGYDFKKAPRLEVLFGVRVKKKDARGLPEYLEDSSRCQGCSSLVHLVRCFLWRYIEVEAGELLTAVAEVFSEGDKRDS